MPSKGKDTTSLHDAIETARDGLKALERSWSEAAAACDAVGTAMARIREVVGGSMKGAVDADGSDVAHEREPARKMKSKATTKRSGLPVMLVEKFDPSVLDVEPQRTGALMCDKRAHRGPSRCEGEVREVVRCDVAGCSWRATRCEAHTPPKVNHLLGAHRHLEHGSATGTATKPMPSPAPAAAPAASKPQRVNSIAELVKGAKRLRRRKEEESAKVARTARAAGRGNGVTPSMRLCKLCDALVFDRDTALADHLIDAHGQNPPINIERSYEPVDPQANRGVR